MAETDTDTATRPPDFRSEVTEKLSAVLQPTTRGGLTDWILELAARIVGLVLVVPVKTALELLNAAARVFVEAKDLADPSFRRMIATAIQGTFGARVDPADFGDPFDVGGDEAADRRIGASILSILSGAASGGIGENNVPTAAGAEHYMGAVTKMAVQGWAQGVLLEIAGAGQVEALATLDDNLTKALGLENITNAIAAPLLDATAIQPFEWLISKRYRHRMLRNTDAVEAYQRGQWTYEQVQEELSRQGLSDDRIAVMVAQGRKRITFEDLVYEHFQGIWSDQQVVEGARDLGIDAYTAARMLSLARSRRIDRYRDPVVDAIVAAYLAGELPESQLTDQVQQNAPSYFEASFIIAAAKTRKQYKIRRLSPADERRLVIAGVRTVANYRRSMERESYDPEAVLALELELRIELDERRDVERARAEAAADRDAEAATRAAEKAQREAELAARKALPAIAEYRRGYVRGLITRDRYAAALQREKVAIAGEDLALLLADADDDRAAYLAAEQERAAAIARVPDPELSPATLEAAVLGNVISLAEYDAQLAIRHYDDRERRVLVSLLAGRVEDRDAAAAARQAATDRAALRGISVADMERAVRLGLRTVEDYARILDLVETPEVQRAVLLDLLRAQLAEDARARQVRAEGEAAAAARGMPLAQRRRAVLAGVAPRSFYERALIAERWPIADQQAELALLDVEIAERSAAAARRAEIAEELDAREAQREADRLAREAAAEEPPPPPELSLSQMERAVKLGVASPDDLRDYLAARGYRAEDAEILVQLVIGDVPNIRAGQAAEQRIAGELRGRGVALADYKRAVARGLRTLQEYADQLGGLGYGEDDGALLVQLLGEELAVDFDSLRAKVEKAIGTVEGAPTWPEIAEALDSGELDQATARELLAQFGVPRDTALVFVRLWPTFRPEA